MTEYWISDPEGRKARVFEASARDEYVRLHGWTDTEPPAGIDQQWVRNVDHDGRGTFPSQAVPLHAGRGWVPCGPPGYDDPAPAGAKTPKPATGGASASKE